MSPRATLSSAAWTAEIWVSTSMQYRSSSTMFCTPRTWPSTQRSRGRRSARHRPRDRPPGRPRRWCRRRRDRRGRDRGGLRGRRVSPVARNLTIFAAALALLFGAGALAGRLIDPGAPGGDAEAHNPAAEETNDMNGAHTVVAADPVRGLAVAENDLRVVIDDAELRHGATEQLRFRIVNQRGEAVRDFDVEHTNRMHLIVARRDLTGFQHLHPEMRADGTWSTDVTLPQAGSYRLFADFSYRNEAITLASDLRVDGDADLRALPAPEPVAVSDGGY